MLVAPWHLIPVTHQSMPDEWVLTSSSAGVNYYLERDSCVLSFHLFENFGNETPAPGGGIFLRELCVFGDMFCQISLCTDECHVSQSPSEHHD